MIVTQAEIEAVAGWKAARGGARDPGTLTVGKNTYSIARLPGAS